MIYLILPQTLMMNCILIGHCRSCLEILRCFDPVNHILLRIRLVSQWRICCEVLFYLLLDNFNLIAFDNVLILKIKNFHIILNFFVLIYYVNSLMEMGQVLMAKIVKKIKQD